MTLYEFDQQYRDRGYSFLCGVDEAGRGPLAGPVYAAAVILPPGLVIEKVNDSKKLTPKRREALFGEIAENATAICISAVSVEEIEELNIRGASLLAMKRVVEGLEIEPDCVLADGNDPLRISYPGEAIVRGDERSASIAAASILAKVERDRYMLLLDREYPEYQFARHMGYGTKLHFEMLDRYGPSPVHRPSFLRKWQAARL